MANRLEDPFFLLFVDRIIRHDSGVVGSIKEQSSATPRRRKWLRRFGVLVLLFGAVLLTMPVWLPWVIVPILEGQGITVASFDRQGMSFLRLKTLGFSNDSTTANVDQLTIQLPHLWLKDRYVGTARNGAAQVEIAGWSVAIQSSGDTNTKSSGSLRQTLDQSTETLNLLRPWIRLLRADDGRVVFQDVAVEIPQINISGDQLTAELSSSNLTTGARLVLGFAQTNAFQLNAVLPDQGATNELSLRRGASNWQFEGILNWQNNAVDLGGTISEIGWLPASATVSGTNWIVAADSIGLDGYNALTGAFNTSWTNGHYQFQVTGEALPAMDNPLVPDSISVDVEGQGTLEAIAIETLNISTPALFAQLSNPLAIDFSGRMLVPEATLNVSAEFIAEDRLPFTGLLEGTLTARPDIREVVNADFEVRLNDFDGFGLNLEQVDLSGAIHWPQMVISNCFFTFPDAGAFAMNGELDLLTQITTNFTWSFNGLVPTNLLPANLTVANWDASGEFAGVWPQLAHQTVVSVNTIGWSGSKLDSATIEVRGEVLRTNDWSMQLSHGVAALSATGSLDLTSVTGSRLGAVLTSVDAVANESTSIKLEQPSAISLSWAAEKTTNMIPRFSLSMDPILMSGGGKQLRLDADVNWPGSGIVSIAATNLKSADMSGLWSAELPEVEVSEFELDANWDAGPVNFTSKVNGSWTLRDVGLISWVIGASGDESGIRLSPSQIGFNGEPAFTFGGKVPVHFIFENGVPAWKWSESGMFDAQMATLPGTALWEEVTDRSTLQFGEPGLELNATGDLERFQSRMKFVAASVSSLAITNLPPGYNGISNVVIEAAASRDRVEIRDGRFLVVGQPAHFDARLPFEADSWEEWFNNLKNLDWKQASGKFQIPAIDMAALDQVAGKFMRPVGQVGLDVRLESGGLVEGAVVFTNLVSRSIEPIGSVRNIQGAIQIKDQRAEFRDFKADVSGRTLRVSGGAGWKNDGLSDVDLSLVATNVTLVRSVDMFLRGDLNLKIQSTGAALPTIGGEVFLHDSLLFQDVGNMMAIDLNQPAKRPPFFSVPQEPFADWLLDIRVKGQQFLRVMSPVFKGKVSTGMQLSGTLKEPIALGEVSIESGQILFPFGSLSVNRGLVQLTRENPYQPKVDFSGQGMNFGYNIGLNVTGNADAPNIVFSSVPPLTTREIMLMMTAGEIPSGDYSYTDVDKASKLGYYLGKELISQLVGLEPGEDKLLFRTGEYVTEDGQLTYRVEYKLINWLSLFGEYTRFRDYNGGLKFNIFSR